MLRHATFCQRSCAYRASRRSRCTDWQQECLSDLACTACPDQCARIIPKRALQGSCGCLKVCGVSCFGNTVISQDRVRSNACSKALLLRKLNVIGPGCPGKLLMQCQSVMKPPARVVASSLLDVFSLHCFSSAWPKRWISKEVSRRPRVCEPDSDHTLDRRSSPVSCDIYYRASPAATQ